MAYRWPAGTVCKRIALDVEDRSGPVCDQRYHPLWRCERPTQVVNRLGRCPAPSCDRQGRPFSPASALSIRMPRWGMGWDVLCWRG